MVFDFTVHNVVGGENMIVFHVEVIAIIIFSDAALPIVTGVDINSIVENMYGRVCHIISRNQVSHFFFHGEAKLVISY